MEKKTLGRVAACFATALFLCTIVLESHAWARAGGGGSSGSRGSRSFSSPSMPSRPSPSSPTMPGSNSDFSTPRGPVSPSPGSPSGLGGMSRSPFMQGLAGGLAGGLLGSLLFGGSGHAAPSGASSGGGIGFLDIVLIGLLAYFAWKFFMKRKRETGFATSYYGGAGRGESDGQSIANRMEPSYEPDLRGGVYGTPGGDEAGLDLIQRTDPSFNVEKFKETVQDMFFRIQAGWMNRTLDGIGNMLTKEMSDYFNNEFKMMQEKNRINRLENIAVRKVEPAEAWQEMGKDYVTVLFTANLLDYEVDDRTGEVVQGDKLNPVKFEEFWTFCREVGAPSWQLAAINQVEESVTRH